MENRVMTGYPTNAVASLLGLSPAQIRGFVKDGFIRPKRGPKGEFHFSFQEVVLLRAARDLCASLPAKRVRRALRSLSSRLPRGLDLAALRIFSDGNEIVVRDGESTWNPESGQTLLDFEVAELAGKIAPLMVKPSDAETSADDWFEMGVELEVCSIDEAKEAYQKALALESNHPDACINLGRILHDEGDAQTASKLYRLALGRRPNDPTALFNLGVALEDLEDHGGALEAYQAAIALDPNYADAHYNAAHLYEQTGDASRALRHLSRYRELLSSFTTR